MSTPQFETLAVAMCLFPGAQLLDFSGPLDLMGFVAPQTAPFISPLPRYALTFAYLGTERSVCTSVGMRVEADATYAEELAKEGGDARQYDVLFVPGGIGSSPGLTPPALIAFLQKQAPGAKYILSVCSGSWILQQAGLLDGRKATTNKAMFNLITGASAQEVQWVRKARWVVDGNTWTASGVTAGLDMAVAWLAHLIGPAGAASVAVNAEHAARAADSDEFADFWTDEKQAALVAAFEDHRSLPICALLHRSEDNGQR